MSEWHYSKNDQQLGPVSSAQLRQLAARGELLPTDLVWKDGMGDWAPASRLKGLFGNANGAPAHAAATYSATATAVAAPPASNEIPLAPQQDTFPARHQPAPAAIAYYNPSAGLAERVALTLKGFPPPTGMQGEWPLTTHHLDQLKSAAKDRKAMRAFNSLCQFFMIFSALGTIGSMIAFASALGGTVARNNILGGTVAETGFALALYMGLTILYIFCGRAAMHCRVWGPITVLSVVAIFTLIAVGSAVIGSSAGARNPEPLVMAFVFLVVGLFAFAFIWVCVKAINGINRFRAAPVWAQEALVYSKL